MREDLELPIVVGRASDVAEPGSFFTHDATGVPILVVRSHGGVVHAFVNICQHRGARLVTEERGAVDSFVCPFHGWTYDLRGALAHVPLPRFFPTLRKDDGALAPLPCAVRHGFVWVAPSPDARIDLESWLGDFEDDLAAFDLARHVVFRRRHTTRTANWKLVMDLFLEGYHVKSLNARTVGRLLREDAVTDRSGPHARAVRARRNLPEIANHARDRWDIRQYASLVYALFPNAFLVVHPDAISQVSVFPATLDTADFVHTLLVPRAPRDEAQRAHHEATWRFMDEEVLSQEDLAMAESVQSVLHAQRSWAFRLGTAEHLVRAFHDELDRAIATRPARRESSP